MATEKNCIRAQYFNFFNFYFLLSTSDIMWLRKVIKAILVTIGIAVTNLSRKKEFHIVWSYITVCMQELHICSYCILLTLNLKKKKDTVLVVKFCKQQNCYILISVLIHSWNNLVDNELFQCRQKCKNLIKLYDLFCAFQSFRAISESIL